MSHYPESPQPASPQLVNVQKKSETKAWVRPVAGPKVSLKKCAVLIGAFCLAPVLGIGLAVVSDGSNSSFALENETPIPMAGLETLLSDQADALVNRTIDENP